MNVNSFKIQGGQLIVAAGRPGMGKTLFMLDQIRYLCGEKGGAALIISLDEFRDKLVERLLSISRADDDGISGWNLVIDDENKPLESICEKIREVKMDINISCVFIDYIQLIGCEHNAKTRNEESGYIMSELKNVAMELDIPIVVLSQLSRACEKRKDHRPVLTDLREIRSEIADVVLLLHREGYYRCDSSNGYGCGPMDAEVIVAKYPNMSEESVTIHMNYSKENGWYY